MKAKNYFLWPRNLCPAYFPCICGLLGRMKKLPKRRIMDDFSYQMVANKKLRRLNNVLYFVRSSIRSAKIRLGFIIKSQEVYLQFSFKHIIQDKLNHNLLIQLLDFTIAYA